MTEVLSPEPSSPGSLKEFTQTRGFESATAAAGTYRLELARYRDELAAARGISLEELHSGRLSDGVGRTAVAAAEQLGEDKAA